MYRTCYFVLLILFSECLLASSGSTTFFNIGIGGIFGDSEFAHRKYIGGATTLRIGKSKNREQIYLDRITDVFSSDTTILGMTAIGFADNMLSRKGLYYNIALGIADRKRLESGAFRFGYGYSVGLGVNITKNVKFEVMYWGAGIEWGQHKHHSLRSGIHLVLH